MSELEQRLSRRVAELRAARELTLERLAEITGFTKGYLSKIENGKAVPPIGTLVNIATALGTDVSDLLDAETSAERNDDICVVRSWQREPVLRGGSSFGYDYVALAHKKHSKRMEPFVMVFPSQIDRDVRFEHEGEEFMFILDGEVEFEVTIEGRAKTWVLSRGDSVYFNSKLPHRSRGLKGESSALVVILRDEAHPGATGGADA
ncbi:MAG: helix-turn-helix domain-containing protein [Candidatus Protistobacter heckmanni]|nr:helix-turn-helix domain-containing protein [Candidatus Protistobacter heckmanni]